MNLQEAFRVAWRAVRANRLRSGLTTLGIVIGVASVIVLVALGDGLRSDFNESFSKLGTQIIVTKSVANVPNGEVAKDLTDSDVEALRDPGAAPDVASVTPVVGGTGLLRAAGGQSLATMTGSTPEFLDVANRELLAGSFYTDDHDRTHAKVIVLGPTPVATLFGGDADAALGKKVRIGRGVYKVIGVVKGDGQQDDIAMMPLSTVRTYLRGENNKVNQIIVRASGTEQVPAALDQVTRILSDRHDISDPAQRDFEAEALQNLLEEANQSLSFLTMFLGAVAAISLIVGGIGVTNIMLVSVTERTREIGIRKAVGATHGAVLKQFLIESTLLAGLGGLVGIAFGIGVSFGAGAYLPSLVPDFPPPQVSIPPVLLAFSISLAIGLVAGCYPAHRAARLRPIEALRFE